MCGFLFVHSLHLYFPLFSLPNPLLSLDTPEENPYFPTYKFPELPEIQQNSEGTMNLESVSSLNLILIVPFLRIRFGF